VALARALAIEPRVLLLDEPFGALDAKVRKELRRWLRDLHDRTGHTTLFVTHDQEEALDLADRVVVMSEGRIEQVGSPEDIYDRPASPFVFDFIGEAARIPVEVRGGVPLLAGRPVPLPADVARPVDGPGVLYVRPENVSIGDAPGAIPGRITSLHRSGSSRRVGIRLDGVDATLEAVAPAGWTPPPVGSEAGFSFRYPGVFAA
jgi:sulfate transport system ATP-binding protein